MRRAGVKAAIDFDGGPTALILTRQTVPVLEGTAERAEQLHRGAYVLSGDAARPGHRPDRDGIRSVGLR